MNPKIKYQSNLYTKMLYFDNDAVGYDSRGIIIYKSKKPSVKLETLNYDDELETVDAYVYYLYTYTNEEENDLEVIKIYSTQSDNINPVYLLDDYVKVTEEKVGYEYIQFKIIYTKTIPERLIKRTNFPEYIDEYLNKKLKSTYDITLELNSNQEISIFELLRYKNENPFLTIDEVTYEDEEAPTFSGIGGTFLTYGGGDIDCVVTINNAKNDEIITINLLVTNIDDIENKNIYFSLIDVSNNFSNSLETILQMDGVDIQTPTRSLYKITNLSNNPAFNVNPKTHKFDCLYILNPTNDPNLFISYEVKFKIEIIETIDENIKQFVTRYATLIIRVVED